MEPENSLQCSQEPVSGPYPFLYKVFLFQTKLNLDNFFTPSPF